MNTNMLGLAALLLISTMCAMQKEDADTQEAQACMEIESRQKAQQELLSRRERFREALRNGDETSAESILHEYYDQERERGNVFLQTWAIGILGQIREIRGSFPKVRRSFWEETWRSLWGEIEGAKKQTFHDVSFDDLLRYAKDLRLSVAFAQQLCSQKDEDCRSEVGIIKDILLEKLLALSDELDRERRERPPLPPVTYSRPIRWYTSRDD